MSTEKPAGDASETREVEDLTKGIEHTRSQMAATVSALEHRLSPAELAGQARTEFDHIETRVKVVIKEGLTEAKKILHEEIEVAKDAVHTQLGEVKEMVTHGLTAARATVKKDIQTAVVATKASIRDATIGRVEHIATQAGDVMNNAKDSLIDTVRNNPVPAAVAGIGLVWLLINRSSASRASRQRTYRPRSFDGYPTDSHASAGSGGHFVDDAQRAVGLVAHRAGDAVHQVGTALGNAGATVAGGLGHGLDAVSNLSGDLAHQAQDAASSMVHTAREHSKRFEQSLGSTLHSNPLALGGFALAVGAAVGYSLPRTQKEDDLMGDVRDRLLHSATDAAHDAAQSLQHWATDAGEAAKAAVSKDKS